MFSLYIQIVVVKSTTQVIYHISCKTFAINTGTNNIDCNLIPRQIFSLCCITMYVMSGVYFLFFLFLFLFFVCLFFFCFFFSFANFRCNRKVLISLRGDYFNLVSYYDLVLDGEFKCFVVEFLMLQCLSEGNCGLFCFLCFQNYCKTEMVLYWRRLFFFLIFLLMVCGRYACL